MVAQENSSWVLRCTEPRSYKDALDLLAHASHEIWMHWMYHLMAVSDRNVIRQVNFVRLYERTVRPYDWLSEKDKEFHINHALFLIRLLDMQEEPHFVPGGVYTTYTSVSDMQDTLAKELHSQYVRWLTYVLELCAADHNQNQIYPMETYARWVRQMSTPFSELSEQEQKSDYMLAYDLAECLGLHMESV